MTVNNDLAFVRDKLVEASTEIVAKIADLEDKLANNVEVDPAVLSEVKALAQSLADVVSDPEVEVPEEPVQLPEV